MSTAATLPVPGEDFPDWVNPFVVKELRQGLRSRIFVGVFVLVHCGVVLVLGLGLLDDAESVRPVSFSVMMQWTIEVACVCLLLPMGGYASVTDEMKADSLELIRVAGVSSRNMAMGKWQALICQSSLMLISVAPYHLMQYYLNHLSPLDQLVGLYFCWLGSLLVGSCMICFATFKLAARLGCLFFGVPFGLVLISTVIGPLAGSVIGAWDTYFARMVVGTVIWAAGVAFFLALAMSGIDLRSMAPANAPLAPDWTREM